MTSEQSLRTSIRSSRQQTTYLAWWMNSIGRLRERKAPTRRRGPIFRCPPPAREMLRWRYIKYARTAIGSRSSAVLEVLAYPCPSACSPFTLHVAGQSPSPISSTPHASTKLCTVITNRDRPSVSSMAFSRDHELMAYGPMGSYIRVWQIEGKPLRSKLHGDTEKVNNRKLIGHSGPVYGLSFSDATATAGHNLYEDEGKPAPETDSKLLLSSSADGTIRLWSLDVWTCLCISTGHQGPVNQVLWGPHGRYFLSGGWDKTVRVWMQAHASAQRLIRVPFS